jgi:hypothetical protein
MSDNPLIYSDAELEQLEQRLEILPDVDIDPEVARKLVDTAIRARRALASLRTGPIKRSHPRTKALIDFGLGEITAEGVHA